VTHQKRLSFLFLLLLLLQKFTTNGQQLVTSFFNVIFAAVSTQPPGVKGCFVEINARIHRRGSTFSTWLFICEVMTFIKKVSVFILFFLQSDFFRCRRCHTFLFPPKVQLSFFCGKMAAPASDVSGYRNDGGALGQDQGLTKNLRGILTAKAPLLSAPGTVLENTLYYDINSSSVTAVEMQATYAKDRIVLNNFTMGASPSAYIPSVLFAGTVYWQVELPDINWPSNATSVQDHQLNICIPHGWGFAALKSIIVYMGASTIAQLQISGMTNYLVNAATCETASKRKHMVDKAGKYLCWMDKQSSLAGPVNNGYVWVNRWYGSFYQDPATLLDKHNKYSSPSMKHASVPLRLPFSSLAVLDKRLSMDTKLSTQPIQITLQTAQPQEFMYLGYKIAEIMGNQWKDSTLQLWQEELSDKSLSVRNELLAMPEFNVGYPFQYAQSIPFEVIASNDTGQTDFVFLMNITSIINSDLTTFLFNVTWDGRTDPAAGQPCPLYGEILEDIELLLNGQRFFFFDRTCYAGVTLAKQLDDPRQDHLLMPSRNVTIDFNQFGGSFVGFHTEGNIYEFNNSRLRAIVAEDNLQNTARFTNQTFQLRFKINRDAFYLLEPGDINGKGSARMTAGFSKNSGFTLNMTYLYNAVFLIGGDGGTTKLITN